MVKQQYVKNFKKNNKIQLNNDIRLNFLLVVTPDNQKIGPLSKKEALELANTYNLDLLVVAPDAKPAVAKILDYGKYKYQKNKNIKKNKKAQSRVENKEIRLKVNIGDHDIKFKANKVREFLNQNNRVKISLKFKGRERANPKLGTDTLNKFYSYIADIAEIEIKPKLTNMFLDMYVIPKKNNKVKEDKSND